jgi:hypothetical protein|tara:strand:- start:1776 stop:2537 length:762 start_codon:yes stop_codon:yes gene_type:complete
MKRKLWTFGDSFSTGESKPFYNRLMDKNFPCFDNQLSEVSYLRSEYKKIAYSTHLSKILDLEDCNLSVGGLGQKGIVKGMVNATHLIKKEDIVIVAYSSPFRGSTPTDWKKRVVDKDSRLDYHSYVMLEYKKYIETTEEILEGKNFIFTQAFNPIFGYFDTSLLMKKNDNFIEWGKKNNTLHDICADTWLREDEENHMMIKGDTFFKPFGAYFREWSKKAEKEKQYLEYCQHPSPKGHELIAKTLLPYIERLL